MLPIFFISLALLAWGQRTAAWFKSRGKKSGELAVGVDLEVVKKEATRLELGYLGLKA